MLQTPFLRSSNYILIVISLPFPLQRQINPACQTWYYYLWHTAVKRRSQNSFFKKSKPSGSILPICPLGLNELTSATLLAAAHISKNAARKPTSSNDTVKCLNVDYYWGSAGWWLCKLKGADHLQGSPGNCTTPHHAPYRKKIIHINYSQIPRAIPPKLHVLFSNYS